jgi:SAM-dependent methyltransferase
VNRTQATREPLAGSELYDDLVFFARYQEMRDAGAGLNEALEQPALRRLLPCVQDTDVVELGCGHGTLARRLAAAGARSVLAVDAAHRMLDRAMRVPDPRVRYLRADIGSLDLAAGATDLVVSSLALHYVADFQALLERVARWLRPGGHLVFSVEHPAVTARLPVPPDGVGGRYDQEGARVQTWFGTPLTKYHRRLATLAGGVLAAGLTLAGLDEPQPAPVAVARRPGLAPYRDRPPLLLISAVKAVG